MRTNERRELIKRLTAAMLPDVARTGINNLVSARQNLTHDNLMFVVEALEIKARFNVMTHTAEFYIGGVLQAGNARDWAMADIEDALMEVKITPSYRIYDMLDTIARLDSYHPVDDLITSREWDGVDRLAELAATVPTDSELWPVYLRKWLIQLVQGVSGWESLREEGHSIPNVLVFVGGQGAGKGRWLRHLLPGYVLAEGELHLNSNMMKDSLLNTLRYPIVELAEIESTFRKSDNEALKGFLARPYDSIRAPYARRAVDRPRMTVFAGSVNSVDFLTDPSGSRRFWPVGLRDGEKLNWSHGIDMQQVLAQANELWESGEDWNLSDADSARRVADAEEFSYQSAGVDLVEGYFHEHKGDYARYIIANKTTIARLVRASTHPSELKLITNWLTRNLGPAKKLKGHQRSWVFPVASGDTFLDGFMPLDDETYVKKHVLAQNARKNT